MSRHKTHTIRAVLEPPTPDDPHWIVSAPALHYHVQGDTRREAVKMFEDGLADALSWAEDEGFFPARQPEMLEYRVSA